MRPPIYKNTTNIFQLEILVNGVAANISTDTVTLYMDKTLGATAPAITVVGDVATSGASGIAIFEITPTLSNKPDGRYYIQAVWTLDGETRSFIVLDDEIDIRDTVKS